MTLNSEEYHASMNLLEWPTAEVLVIPAPSPSDMACSLCPGYPYMHPPALPPYAPRAHTHAIPFPGRGGHVVVVTAVAAVIPNRFR